MYCVPFLLSAFLNYWSSSAEHDSDFLHFSTFAFGSLPFAISAALHHFALTCLYCITSFCC